MITSRCFPIRVIKKSIKIITTIELSDIVNNMAARSAVFQMTFDADSLNWKVLSTNIRQRWEVATAYGGGLVEG